MKKIFKMKKASVLFLSLILAASMLTACSGTKKDNTTEKTDANNTSNNSAEETKEPVEITMWGSWGGDQVAQLEAQIANFNNSQDEIIVKYAVQDSLEQKLLTAIASNEVPDIVLWDRFNTGVYAPKGALSPLDDLVKRDGIDLTKFYEPAVDELTSNGTLYGIPLTVDARVLFYNKDMFAEANIDPASIQTWDDLRDAAIKLTKRENGTLVQAGLSLRDVGLFNNWIVQAGGKMIDDSTNPPTVAFNTQAGLDVLTFWSKLQNEDKVYDLGFEDGYGGDGFKAGKVAITYNGPWTLESYKDAGLNFGVIQPVEGPTGIRSAATIAACLLYKNLKEETYLEKALKINEWQREKLFDEVSGAVYDAYHLTEGINTWTSTYNQGTFIGAATMLYEHTGDKKYLEDAKLAADYTMIHMYHYGVMNNEEEGNDLPGFKGILARWLGYYIKVSGRNDYNDWFIKNAKVAWNNRNSSGITWTQWAQKTEDQFYTAWGCSAVVSLLQNCPSE